MPAKAIMPTDQQQPQSRNHGVAQYKLWTHKVLPALLLLCCCWLVFYVAGKGLASAYYFKANHYLELWQRKPETLDTNSWQQAAEAIETAAKYHPNNPHYLITQAKINEWGWYKGLKTAEQIAINDQLYQQAILLRPNWPNAYADYAYYLGIVNFRVSEAFIALAKADKYGPYTRETLQQRLIISATRWTVLNANQKSTALKILEEMLLNSSTTYKHAVNISWQYKLRSPFCTYLRLRKNRFSLEMQKQIHKDFC